MTVELKFEGGNKQTAPKNSTSFKQINIHKKKMKPSDGNTCTFPTFSELTRVFPSVPQEVNPTRKKKSSQD